MVFLLLVNRYENLYQTDKGLPIRGHIESLYTSMRNQNLHIS